MEVAFAVAGGRVGRGWGRGVVKKLAGQDTRVKWPQSGVEGSVNAFAHPFQSIPWHPRSPSLSRDKSHLKPLEVGRPTLDIVRYCPNDLSSSGAQMAFQSIHRPRKIAENNTKPNTNIGPGSDLPLNVTIKM